MVFDFLGDKTKVVIAMAHIGALPAHRSMTWMAESRS